MEQIIDEKTRAEYFKRVFVSIDGLWFMKLEENSDFENALEIDRRVWMIVPKIQFRALKALLGLEGAGLEILKEALSAKARIEEYPVELSIPDDGLLVMKVLECPWLALMKKSGREHLAGRVGETICSTEYPVWMREAGVNGTFELGGRICDGGEFCEIRFHSSIAAAAKIPE